MEAKMKEPTPSTLVHEDHSARSLSISFHLHDSKQMSTSSHFFIFVFFVHLLFSSTDATQLNIVNNCKESICFWVQQANQRLKMAAFTSTTPSKKLSNFHIIGRDESGKGKAVASTNSPAKAPVKPTTATNFD